MRVVSLVPSATETLIAWGVEPVAVTRFCEQPGLVTVGGTKDPDLPAIEALAPDLVVMCVEENRREDADHLTAAGIAIHAIDIDTVADVPAQMDLLAARLDLDVPEIVLPPRPEPSGRRAFVPIWRRPWMTISGRTYAASVLSWLGIETVFADHADRYPTIELDGAVGLRPDLVIAPDEPYPFGERHRSELSAVAPVCFVDGQDLVWWGIRTPAALNRLRSEMARVPT